MTRCRVVLSWVLGFAFVLSGCSDQMTGPPEVEEELLEPQIRLGETSNSANAAQSPFGCFTSVRQSSGLYRHGRLPINIPPSAVDAADGRTAALIYRERDEEGDIVRLANCVAPDVPFALHVIAGRLIQGPYEIREPGTAPGVIAAASFDASTPPTVAMASTEECESPDETDKCYVIDPIEVEGEKDETEPGWGDTGGDDYDDTTDPGTDEPYGGGGGGGTGTSDGTDDGSSDSSSDKEVDSSLEYPSDRLEPDCNSYSSLDKFGRAYCDGWKPTREEMKMIEAAFQRMELLGPECRAIVEEARATIAAGKFRIFEFEYGMGFSGAAEKGGDWQIHGDVWFTEFEIKKDANGRNLAHSLAHETDHQMGHGHIGEGKDWVDPNNTPHSDLCAGNA